MSNRGAHWKSKTPGAVQQYINQDATADEIIIRHVATHSGMISVRFPRRCMDCGDTKPYSGFAPVFNLRIDRQRGEVLILVCLDCYDKRCVIEALLERKAG